MQVGRWCTAIGSLILGIFGILHGVKLTDVEKMMLAGGVKAPLDGLVKASWLIFAVEMVVVAIIAIVASRMPRGARIIFLCAAMMVANALLVLHFFGPFIGVYAISLVATLYVAGGLIQRKSDA
jgi:hypothetical protein